MQTEYSEKLQATAKSLHSSQRTVLFFLVDGLALHTVKDELERGHLKEIKSYFMEDKKTFYQARTTFPSLTFPGIGSLLTERPIEKNGIFGNLILAKDDRIDFELPQYYPKLNSMIDGKNVFSRLEKKGFRTASFDYSFIENSSVHVDSVDSDVAVALLNKDYNYVDKKLIQSLELLLTQTQPENWPDFIFVHLIGVDFISHEYGPESQAVKDYLKNLDRQLASVFHILSQTASSQKHQVITMMSSDHGFDQTITKQIEFEERVKQTDRKILILNEGRFAGVYFPKNYDEKQRASFLRHWAQNLDIDIVAIREGEQVFVKSHSLEVEFSYIVQNCKETSFSLSILGQVAVCPEQLNPELNHLYYPYFLVNLASYFQSENHPDAVIIPKPGVSFRKNLMGQHGGPTPQELFVPLLIRGGNLGDTNKIPALWELLRFM